MHSVFVFELQQVRFKFNAMMRRVSDLVIFISKESQWDSQIHLI
jgi:hypothetical protein